MLGTWLEKCKKQEEEQQEKVNNNYKTKQMGYKMKGSPMQYGTSKHKSALKIKSVESRKAEIAASGASAEGSGTSPTKMDPMTMMAVGNAAKGMMDKKKDSPNKQKVSKTTRKLGDEYTTTKTKKSSIYDKDKFDKSMGRKGSIGYSKKYTYQV